MEDTITLILVLLISILITAVAYLAFPVYMRFKRGKLPLKKASFYCLINVVVVKIFFMVLSYAVGATDAGNLLPAFIYYAIGVMILKIKVPPQERENVSVKCKSLLEYYFEEKDFEKYDLKIIKNEVDRTINEYSEDFSDAESVSRHILRKASFRILCQDVLTSQVNSEKTLNIFNDTSGWLISNGLLPQEEYDKNLEYLVSLNT
ncbi:MAG: hypothetical protein IJ459_02015 [Clostridia bacterium]|nr:hypothetical protein [Clostridia bacterium]